MIDICNYLSFQSAACIADKYNVGNLVDHELKVASFAAAIFDETRELHKLSDIYRNLLCFSALIHDSGCFLNKSKHHKHTKYIVLSDSIFDNIPDYLRGYLAIVASSHRKTIDKSMAFYNESVQYKLKILISILRVSDSLDHTHKLNNTLESIILDEKYLTLYINSDDFQKTLVKFDVKSQLFNDIFKIRARLEPEIR
ncbi:hypothetical protein ACSVC9_00015 [Clostridium sp. LBM24168]